MPYLLQPVNASATCLSKTRILARTLAVCALGVLLCCQPGLSRAEQVDVNRAGPESQALGLALARTCSGCHGEAGRTMPSLETLTARQMLIKLQAYKSDRVRGTVMNRLSKGYTDEELALISRALTND